MERLETEAAILAFHAVEGTEPGDRFSVLELREELCEAGLAASSCNERVILAALNRLSGWGLVLSKPGRGRYGGWYLEVSTNEFEREVIEAASNVRFDAITDEDWCQWRADADAHLQGDAWSRSACRRAAFRLVGGSSRVRSLFQQIAIVPSARGVVGVERETPEERRHRDKRAAYLVREGDREGFTQLLKQYLIADLAPRDSVTTAAVARPQSASLASVSTRRAA